MNSSDKGLKEFIRESGITSLAEELFDTLPGIFFFIKDRQHRGVWTNHTIWESRGLSYQDDLSESLVATSSKPLRQIEETVMNEGTAIKNKFHLVMTVNKKVKWQLTSWLPLYGTMGVIKGIAGISREIKNDDHIIKHHPSMDRALDYISNHFSEVITLDRLAGIAQVGVDALERHFKKSLHMTPTEYLNNYRICQAGKELLLNNNSVSSIAERCGFNDQDHFLGAFEKSFHFSPTTYRRRYQ